MEDLSKSIDCLEQIIFDKRMKVGGAVNCMTIARCVMDRLATGTLTTEEASELLQAQKQHQQAKRCVDAEMPMVDKLEKNLQEMKTKLSKAEVKPAADEGGSSSSQQSLSSTINMIEVRTKRELIDMKAEFKETRNKLMDSIEDCEEDLLKPMTTEKKNELDSELSKLRRLLKRVQRDHDLKVENIKNIAEIEKERAKVERQQQQELYHDNESFKTPHEDDMPPVDNNPKTVAEWVNHLPEVPSVSPAHEMFNFDVKTPGRQETSYQKRELPTPQSVQNCGAMDKDAMIIHLMQTQLGVMQRSQGSYADRKLPDFSGDPSDWGNFYAAFVRTQEKYNFDDSENLARLQTALKGPAKEAVKHLLCNVANLEKFMEVLKLHFGRPEFILDFLMAKAKNCKKPDLSKPETVVSFGRAVEDLVANICAFNEQDYMQNKQLVVELVDKMPGPMRDKWYSWLEDDGERKINLRNFSMWLSKQMRIAIRQVKPTVMEEKTEEKPPSRFRRSSGAVNVSEGEEKEPRKVCSVCSGKGHGIDNCWSLKKKTLDERWKLVRQERVCYSCLKPGHMTRACQEARKCDMDGCTRMHHRLLHSSTASEESDSSRAKDKDGGTETYRADGSIGVAMSIVKGFDGPLPIVPVRLTGRLGETIMTYALLDSGATRTLIKKSLADKLDLHGQSVHYRYKLINGEIVENKSAKKVDFKISGKYRNAPTFHLTDAITVEKIGLSPYSIDVEAAKMQWPHLRRYKGPSLSNAKTEIVIGTDYGYLMMHKQLLYTGLEDPVGIRTVLGWAIQGKLKTTDIVGTSYHIGGIGLDDTLPQLIKQSSQLEDYGKTESQAKSMSNEDERAVEMSENNSRQQNVAFLMQKEGMWPQKEEPGAVSVMASDDEEGADNNSLDLSVINSVLPNVEKFSNYYRVVAPTAAVSVAAKYWIANVRKPTNKRSPRKKTENGLVPHTSAGEFMGAGRKLSIYLQHKFRKDLKVNSTKFNKMKDEHRIMRMMGRIDKAKVGREVRRLIVLAVKNHLVDFLVFLEHARNAHTGRSKVYNKTRQRFFIPVGRHAGRRSWSRCRIKKAKHYIPEIGGAWESMVKLVKKALNNMVKALSLLDQVVLTAFKALEFIFNSRPLGFVSGDRDYPEMLTSNHFLRGVGVSSCNADSRAAVSGSSFLSDDITNASLKWGKQFEEVQAMAKLFWDRSSKEVPPELRRRSKFEQSESWSKATDPNDPRSLDWRWVIWIPEETRSPNQGAGNAWLLGFVGSEAAEVSQYAGRLGRQRKQDCGSEP